MPITCLRLTSEQVLSPWPSDQNLVRCLNKVLRATSRQFAALGGGRHFLREKSPENATNVLREQDLPIQFRFRRAACRWKSILTADPVKCVRINNASLVRR